MIDFNFYGPSMIQGTFYKILTTSQDKDTIKSKIIGKELVDQVNGKPFRMVIDTFSISIDIMRSLIFKFEGPTNRGDIGRYVKIFTHTEYEQLRYRGRFVEWLLDELDRKKRVKEPEVVVII